jgi:hypothetical protein
MSSLNRYANALRLTVGMSSLLRASGLSVMLRACLLGGARDILLLVLLLSEHCCLLSTAVALACCGQNDLQPHPR